MVARESARSSFPQDRRKLSVCEVDGMELEEKTDCRYKRERDKCRTLCGTTCYREVGLGLSPSQSWVVLFPCQGLA